MGIPENRLTCRYCGRTFPETKGVHKSGRKWSLMNSLTCGILDKPCYCSRQCWQSDKK